MAYPGAWTANLATPEEKAAFESLLGINNKVLDRLQEICYNMINELENKSSDFDNPNWALRQANFVGQKKSLERVVALCKNSQGAETPTP
jgi:hypothetical protein